MSCGSPWSRDGTSVIYSARQGSLRQMWRADADGARPPERIAAGVDVMFPAIAPSGDRLAYSHAAQDSDIFRIDPPQPARPIARSSATESLPQISPDSRRMAYCSAREADAFEVWTANLDGSSPERLTHGPGQWQCSPSCIRAAIESVDGTGVWYKHEQGEGPLLFQPLSGGAASSAARPT